VRHAPLLRRGHLPPRLMPRTGTVPNNEAGALSDAAQGETIARLAGLLTCPENPTPLSRRVAGAATL
jgi:hypothetical protein